MEVCFFEVRIVFGSSRVSLMPLSPLYSSIAGIRTVTVVVFWFREKTRVPAPEEIRDRLPLLNLLNPFPKRPYQVLRSQDNSRYFQPRQLKFFQTSVVVNPMLMGLRAGKEGMAWVDVLQSAISGGCMILKCQAERGWLTRRTCSGDQP